MGLTEKTVYDILSTVKNHCERTKYCKDCIFSWTIPCAPYVSSCRLKGAPENWKLKDPNESINPYQE